MEKKPNNDAMEAMREMVRNKMGYGASTEGIIRDILGWGDVKGITEMMVLDEIRAYQKQNQGKPGSPVIKECVVHSPKDLPEPITPMATKSSRFKVTKTEGNFIVYVRAMSLDDNIKTLEGLLTMATTHNKTLDLNWSPERILKLGAGFWEERVRRDVKAAKKYL